mgnify:FL=1
MALCRVLANDEDEHQVLTDQGYAPAYAPPADGQTRDSVMKKLDDAGIEYDRRLSLGNLKKLLPG